MQMPALGVEGFDSLLLPLTIAALLMALLRASISVCARATEARDARAITRALQATKNVRSVDSSPNR
jgi:hypothetical protein